MSDCIARDSAPAGQLGAQAYIRQIRLPRKVGSRTTLQRHTAHCAAVATKSLLRLTLCQSARSWRCFGHDLKGGFGRETRHVPENGIACLALSRQPAECAAASFPIRCVLLELLAAMRCCVDYTGRCWEHYQLAHPARMLCGVRSFCAYHGNTALSFCLFGISDLLSSRVIFGSIGQPNAYTAPLPLAER